MLIKHELDTINKIKNTVIEIGQGFSEQKDFLVKLSCCQMYMAAILNHMIWKSGQRSPWNGYSVVSPLFLHVQ